MSAEEVSELPPGVVTITWMLPALPAGEVTVIWVLLTTVIEVPELAPNVTAVVPRKLEPVIVTEVPPVVGPALGETAATDGFAR